MADKLGVLLERESMRKKILCEADSQKDKLKNTLKCDIFFYFCVLDIFNFPVHLRHTKTIENIDV